MWVRVWVRVWVWVWVWVWVGVRVWVRVRVRVGVGRAVIVTSLERYGGAGREVALDLQCSRSAYYGTARRVHSARTVHGARTGRMQWRMRCRMRRATRTQVSH
jgi:hypothetical protein